MKWNYTHKKRKFTCKCCTGKSCITKFYGKLFWNNEIKIAKYIDYIENDWRY